MLCPQEGEPPIAQDEPISLYQNTLLAWGNLLYEESQLAAATGSDWRPILDAATARFREAGCNEPDIIGKSPPPTNTTHSYLTRVSYIPRAADGHPMHACSQGGSVPYSPPPTHPPKLERWQACVAQ